jgi:hypothetical protein
MIFGRHHATYPGILVDLAANAVITSIWVLVLVRFGLLVCMSGAFFMLLLNRSAVIFELQHWHGAGSWSILLLAVAILAYAFWTSLAGRTIWQDEPAIQRA